VTVDGRAHRGHAIELTAEVCAREVVAAVRGGDSRDDPGGGDGSGSVVVDCPEQGAVHERIGLITPDSAVRVRRALVAAARSRGLASPVADELAAVRESLADLSIPDADPESARQRVADVTDEERRLDERAATVRGRVQALSEVGADTTEAQAELDSVMESLSAVRTERIAAEQALARERERAMQARRERERRLRLRDRHDNLQRQARSALVDRLRGEYADAVRSVPGPTPADPFDADAVTAALAVGRLADCRAPLVLDCDRFPDAATAADWLDAPVVRL
jgi:hypothetical protein